MTSREVLEQALHRLIEPDSDNDFMSPDVVVETPFAPAGPPRRYVGRAAFLDATRERRASIPVRLEEVRDIVVHETTNPEVVVAEFTIAGTVLATNRPASAPFVVVAGIRDGLVTLWREYQDTAAMAAAMSA